MNSTHIHLLLNHFPIIGILIATIFLLYAVWKKENSIQQISLFTVFIMALIAIPVFLTGEPAEESVEKLPGVIESIIEAHEESAELAFWFMMAAGALSLISFALQVVKNTNAKRLVIVSLMLCIITSALMVRTGYLGGQIRHTEIRANGSSAQTNEQGAENENEE